MFGLIGQRQRFFFITETLHREHRTEQLGIDDVQRGAGGFDDGRLEELRTQPLGLVAAGDQGGALLDGAVDLLADVADLRGGAEQPHLGLLGHGVADADAPGGTGHGLEEAVGDPILQEQARAGDTALTGRPEDARDRAVDRAFKVGVVKDDEG